MNFQRIRELREKRGLTQGQAAKAAKLGNAQRWCDIESGRKASITVATLENIAAALGVSPAELLR